MITLAFVAYFVAGVVSLLVADRGFKKVNKRFAHVWYARYAIALADGWLHAIVFFFLIKIGSLGREKELFDSVCVFGVLFLAGTVARLLSYRLKTERGPIFVPKKQFWLMVPGLLLGLLVCAVAKAA